MVGLAVGLLDPDDLDASKADDDLDASGEGRTDQFVAALKLLADTAADEIKQLASRKSRRGRPAKNAPFRELIPILVRKYERFMKEPAGCPYWLPDSSIYGGKGDFHLFAVAVWRCLQDSLPSEAFAVIPSSEGALAQELQKHWPKTGPKGENRIGVIPFSTCAS